MRWGAPADTPPPAPPCASSRKATSTRLPGCTVPRNISGTAYVNVVRSGTASATLQKGGVIPPCSVPARGNAEESAEKKKGCGMTQEIYLLMRKIPAEIVMIPAHCQRDTCSLKKMAASPTVTAPYSELRTVMTATCSIFIPRLLRQKALESKAPIPGAIQRTLPRGRRPGCLERRITMAVTTALVKRIIHTV